MPELAERKMTEKLTAEQASEKASEQVSGKASVRVIGQVTTEQVAIELMMAGGKLTDLRRSCLEFRRQLLASFLTSGSCRGSLLHSRRVFAWTTHGHQGNAVLRMGVH